MLFIDKMKSLLSSPALSTFFSPRLPKITPSSVSLPISETLILFRSQSLHDSGLLHATSLSSSQISISTSQMEATGFPCGEIHVIVGPMFAGKTTALLQRIQAQNDHGRSVALIKSSKDTRYGLDSVVTHDGTKLPCWALSNLSSFRQKLGPDAYDKVDVIGIDEAQFFEDLYDFCCKAADHDGKIVILAGLDGDYLRRSFGSVLDIVPIAPKLSARCNVCGKRAFFTLRKSEETQTELIGGADYYMPVCRQHYVNGQVVVEATRTVLKSKKLPPGKDGDLCNAAALQQAMVLLWADMEMPLEVSEHTKIPLDD